MRICLLPRPPEHAEQSTGIGRGLLAREDGSIESADSLSTNCVGRKAKQERKPRGRETILAALSYGSLSTQPSLLLPLLGVPPSDPSPCSDMPQFHFYCRNTSHLKGWIEKNAARELEPVCRSQSQQSRVSTSVHCPRLSMASNSCKGPLMCPDLQRGIGAWTH